MRDFRGVSKPFRCAFSGALLWAMLSGATVAQATQASGEASPATAQKPAVPSGKVTDGAAQKDAKTVPMSPEEERQAQLVADTNKLYELAQELKAEVAKSNKDTLSVSVIKKAAEVEKLAKSLKERMRK